MIAVRDIPLDWFLDAFRQQRHITVSRWGDGEWRSVLGEETGTSNCDGHPYTEALTEDLRAILRRRPDYMMGMQDMAKEGWGDKIEGWLDTNVPEGFKWVRGDVFHRGAIAGRLQDIAESIRRRTTIVIGPKHLQHIEPMKHTKDVSCFPPYFAITIPDQHAYSVKDQIIETSREAIEKNGPDAVVSVSAGMTGEIIVDALHETHGNKNTIVDFGALWDPLAGVNSRNYMRMTDDS